ncbi:hypothetical protein [Actinoplanes sp. NPDC051494]|uniref:hypothetical protein n=1 Tax=Actinoplanes sp. NPDC051494 TaxID=3363907 RepID=UPI0037915F60
MRIPTFSRQSDTTTETTDRAPVAARTDTAPAADGRTTTVITKQRETKPQDDTTASLTPVAPAPVRTSPPPAPPVQTRPAQTPPVQTRPAQTPPVRDADVKPDTVPTMPPVVAGPKPRASLLAMLGLITGVVAALLVLSGPLLGYGVGVAGLALLLSLGGIHGTRKRHVAGKTDALIGMALALGAIVVGVLALTGSLSWLGTDMQPVTSLREWLDTQFVDRF